MSATVEVINIENSQGISELSGLVYANKEPGFQVDEVETYKQLMGLLSAIKQAAPTASARKRIKFNEAYSTRGTEPGGYAHLDTGFVGLAAHQEASEGIPVQLATANSPYYVETRGYIDLSKIRNLKHGFTKPGRFTIFSAGNMPEISLRPTVHFFDRQDPPGIDLWTRYSTACDFIQPFLLRTFAVKRTAKRTLARLQEAAQTQH